MGVWVPQKLTLTEWCYPRQQR